IPMLALAWWASSNGATLTGRLLSVIRPMRYPSASSMQACSQGMKLAPAGGRPEARPRQGTAEVLEVAGAVPAESGAEGAAELPPPHLQGVGVVPEGD